MSKETRYIIIWNEKLNDFAVFYKSMEEAKTKMLQLSPKEGRIHRVIIENPKGVRNGKT